MKRILSIVLVLALALSMFSVNAFAEDTKAKVYLDKTEAWGVEKDETKIYVPIMVDGTIDMQCYDITVTYDKSWLDVVAEETKIILPSGDYKDDMEKYGDETDTFGIVNTGTAGTIRFSGMTAVENAKTATGQIGVICFTAAKRPKDGTEVALGLEVIELGFGTEVADIEVVADGVLVLNKTAKVEVLLGDVNQDNEINAKDALEVLKHAAKIVTLEGDALTAADANKDGSINAQDALAILKHVAKIELLS